MVAAGFELDQEKAGSGSFGGKPLRLKLRGGGRFCRRGGGDGLIAQPDLLSLAVGDEMKKEQTRCKQDTICSRQIPGLHQLTVSSQRALSKRCGNHQVLEAHFSFWHLLSEHFQL